jgi:hypothetical protein
VGFAFYRIRLYYIVCIPPPPLFIKTYQLHKGGPFLQPGIVLSSNEKRKLPMPIHPY